MSYEEELENDKRAIRDFLEKKISELKIGKSYTEYHRDCCGFIKEGCNYQIRSYDRQIKILTKLLKEV